jgi:hypothetical protein
VYRFESSGRVREEHRLTVLFEDDKLARWSNDNSRSPDTRLRR